MTEDCFFTEGFVAGADELLQLFGVGQDALGLCVSAVTGVLEKAEPFVRFSCHLKRC